MSQSPPRSEHGFVPDSQTRVDSAHEPEISASGSSLPIELLEAIAGQDSEQATLQLRRQALELAGLLQEKQRTLDHRESELNARTALLENELRTHRLKQQTASSAGHAIESELESRPTLTEALAARAEVESGDLPTLSSAEQKRSDPEMGPPSAVCLHSDRSGSETAPAALDGELSAELRQRHAKLDARQQQLDQLQEQITGMHRESLELRLATEELWAELVHQASPDELSERLADLRNRLAEHYRLANESLAQRTDELHRKRQELNDQQQQLRGQRRELQLWVDRRYDEIETRTSRLIARERELDRLEAEFERQSMQWQRQREAYRKEIEQLTRSVSA